MKRFIMISVSTLAFLSLTACSSSKTSISSSSSSSKSSSSSISKSSSSGSLASSSEASSSSSETAQGMNLTQIAAGDFSSLDGTWKDNSGNTLVISNSNASSNEKSGKLKLNPVGGSTPSLLFIASGDTTGPAVSLYPAGKAITSGSDSTYKDLSVQDKDRIVVTNGGLTSEQTATEVFYRQ